MSFKPICGPCHNGEYLNPGETCEYCCFVRTLPEQDIFSRIQAKDDQINSLHKELRAANARIAELESALQYARPLVEKWCAYQGDNVSFQAETLAPIDAALTRQEAKADE